jgi:hypothetical protein
MCSRIHIPIWYLFDTDPILDLNTNSDSDTDLDADEYTETDSILYYR